VIDHRRVQRLLFRMQLDREFAAAFRAGSAEEPGLQPEERALLLRASPEALAADHRGRRRAQVLGNIASEYVLTLTEAASGPLGAAFMDEFPRSAEFHAAVSAEQRLPIAFGAWASRRAAEAGAGVLAAFAALESKMAEARREPRPASSPRRGEVALSERAWLLELPDGAFEHAQDARLAADGSLTRPPVPPELAARAENWLAARGRGSSAAAEAVETILLVVVEAPGGHRLREVAPERLEPDASALLCEAREALSEAALARLAASRNWEASDVAAFVDALVAEGVLRRG
jgi:hypothetical protein